MLALIPLMLLALVVLKNAHSTVLALLLIEMVLTKSLLTGANSTGKSTFFCMQSPKISTSWKKIAQIYLPDLPLFASLGNTIQT